jgi:hypothetical protein
MCWNKYKTDAPHSYHRRLPLHHLKPAVSKEYLHVSVAIDTCVHEKLATTFKLRDLWKEIIDRSTCIINKCLCTVIRFPIHKRKDSGYHLQSEAGQTGDQGMASYMTQASLCPFVPPNVVSFPHHHLVVVGKKDNIVGLLSCDSPSWVLCRNLVPFQLLVCTTVLESAIH